MISNGV